MILNLINQKKVKKIVFLGLFFCFLVIPIITFIPVEKNNNLISIATVSAATGATAESSLDGLNKVVNGTELKTGTTDLKGLILSVVKVVLGFLGIVAVIMIIIGGFIWMTAGGNEEKSKKAKEFLVNAVIGLIIVLVAYTIISWVITTLQGNTVLNSVTPATTPAAK
ncbi:hypothetical protein CVV26_01600 [Candidatus Kuenenbacteria bacterium HGW-Kuenenbacteria-1]|uniref:Uncharacterized protein n=1 Tax=Candidatus Kuenenbacteria bacterium HGW-Kuenenbacteria-1 TaxID=2013812 RepID=A0A2N1UNL9_9BACT|nr:MAG: hypothetical protein CVV26_01600 [Candidatus Kuenenbacteria bacterium HGW-Kuenenbacteria-1]